MKRRLIAVAIALIVIALVAVGLVPADRQSGEAPPPAYTPSANTVERGRQLVTLADCRSCHTAIGGKPFAGGRVIPTPFGTFFSPNITPDSRTGIGGWTADDFWRALHDGYSRDGTRLYPVFPYPSYTGISRHDADAMYAYLETSRRHRSRTARMSSRFRTTIGCCWRRGACSSFGRACTGPIPRAAPSGTAARTSSVRSPIATRVTRRAMRWAPSGRNRARGAA